MNPQLAFLASARVNGIMQGITDPRLLPGKLIWRDRIPDRPALEEEILAKFVGTLLIADMIADDAKAVTYSMGRFQYETTKVPNLKMGIGLTQSMLNTLNRIQQMGGVVNDDTGMFTDYQNMQVTAVKYGVELRAEVLRVAMLCDGLNYDRLGIKMSGVTWGMYSDLKITPSVGWASTSSTPITDINTAIRIAQQRYGVTYNRATMSLAAFQAMVATTEFINQAKTWGFGMFSGTPTPALPLQSASTLQTILEKIIGGSVPGFQIEIDDRRFWSQDNSGAITNNRIHPLSSIVLTDSGNDGNVNAYDFANGIVTESIVANLAPSNVIGNIPVGRGPIAYTTLADSALNPPGVVTWGVKRGFPRKHLNAASAVLNVGTLSEPFSVSLPAVL